VLLLGIGRAQAQHETYNWRFSTSAGLNFPASGPPVAITTGRMLNVGEACSAASDAAGNLRCYSDGVQVWDRTDAPMPNGRLRPDNYATSATQGALLVPNPGNAQEYYLFTVDPISPTRAPYGLRYSVVEMGLRGGLGDIGTRKDIAVPLPDGQLLVTEKLTATLLPNGRDYWILVHGLGNNKFYSFLLTAAGLRPVPVVSSVGAVHRRSGGYMRLSPDAQQLAVTELPDHIELFDFDNSSGQLTSARSIAVPNVPQLGVSGALYYYYGLEFSADGSKLYTTNTTAPAYTTPAQGLYQIDLANGDAVTFLGLDYTAGALLRGPDDRIYVAQDRGASLAVITAPNAPGLACGLQARGVALAPGTTSGLGLPNFAVVPTAPILRLSLRVASPNLCLGQGPAAFNAAVTPAGTNASFTWDFGDPAAGAANVATGSAASHTYAAVGTYVVTVAAVLAGGGTLTARQTVTVAPTPTLRLAPHQQVLCAGLPLIIEASAQPDGTTYRWHDGLTTPAREVSSPGRYVLTVTSAAGCSARDSVDVHEPLPTDDCIARRVPNIITPNGDGQNDTFVLGSLLAPSWSLTVFNRWGREVFQQASYDNSWDAPGLTGGVYYYLLLNPATGARLRGWVLVSK
jgi:gliding motility-associated-like protein